MKEYKMWINDMEEISIISSNIHRSILDLCLEIYILTW